jgi:hypothetical protein
VVNCLIACSIDVVDHFDLIRTSSIISITKRYAGIASELTADR